MKKIIKLLTRNENVMGRFKLLFIADNESVYSLAYFPDSGKYLGSLQNFVREKSISFLFP